MIQFNNNSKLVVPVSSSTTEALHDAKTKNQNDTSTDITDDETALSSSMSSSIDSINTSVNSPISSSSSSSPSSSSSSSSQEEVDERLQDLIDDNKWQEVDILWDVDEDDDEEDDDCSSDDDDSECSSVEPSNNDVDDYYSLSSDDDESSVVGEEIIAYGDGCEWKEVNLWEDEEEDDVCYGKHCDKKSCLKLATGWNRLWGGVADKRFEVNLYCDDCFEQDCFEKCEACCVVYPMTSLNYRTGGLFGEHCGNNLYCGACCKDIEKRMTLPDEDELV